jgi:hypothetical protein
MWDSLYRRVGGPRAPWYVPETVWWIETKSERLRIDSREAADSGESAIEWLVAQGFEPAAVNLRTARWHSELITLVRLKFLDHQKLVATLEVEEPRNVSPDVPSPFRWGGEIPDGWIVWREELVPGSDALTLIKPKRKPRQASTVETKKGRR